jgi:predicted nucleic acid-binding protein
MIDKKLHRSRLRFEPSMAVAEAEQYLTTTLRPLLAVHPSASFFSEALRLKSKHAISWYDALIVTAAIMGECKVLYSEDLPHGQRFGDLRIENPFQ